MKPLHIQFCIESGAFVTYLRFDPSGTLGRGKRVVVRFNHDRDDFVEENMRLVPVVTAPNPLGVLVKQTAH